jgi:Outer membrane protein beta-barrel domain
MKKLILSATLFISVQSYSQQVQTFIFAGLQGNSVKYTIKGDKQNTSFKIGGNAGIGMKVPFEGRLSFVPMFYYSMKGYDVKFDRLSALPDPTAVNNNTTIHCVELAGLLQHDFNNSPDHFFFRIGPGLDFQLFGNEKFDNNTGGTVDRSMKFAYDRYGRYSGNAHFHFGYEKANSFFIYAQYTFGLASISNYDGGPQIRYRIPGISAGFFLKKK